MSTLLLFTTTPDFYITKGRYRIRHMDQPLSEQAPFTVTTLNTHFGQAVATPWASKALEGSDIVLLQEVLRIDPLVVQRNLGTVGLRLAAHDEHTGLAIAVSDMFQPVKEEHYALQIRSKLVDVAEHIGIEHRLRERGMLLMKLFDKRGGNTLFAATAHPIVPVRPIARAKQVGVMAELMSRRYATGPFILGADMNHFPAANKVDQHMAAKGRLKPVSNNDPTCLLQNTKHGWLRRFGVPDARLDTLLFRNLTELSSDVVHAESDHMAIQATFVFNPKN